MRLSGLLQTIQLEGEAIALYVPDAAAAQEAYEQGAIPFPYWSKVWPAAIGLGNFLLHHPHYIQNKNVVELAAGLGLPSLVAAGRAASVLCSDYVPEAVALAQHSADYNRLKNFSSRVLDWYHLPEDLSADVILLSDVSYDPVLFGVQEKLITGAVQRGATVIISTPQRLTAKEAVTPLLAFCTGQQEVTVTQNADSVAITILVLEKR